MSELAAAIISIALAIPGGIFGYKKLIERKKSKSPNPIKGRRVIVKDFKISRKIKIDSWNTVSAVFEGSVESGFLDLMIDNSVVKPQWFADKESVEGKRLDSGEYIETGKLNFTNGRYEGEWKFKPVFPLKPGKAKAIMAMYEDKDYVGTDGKTMSNRPYIDLLEKEIILY